MAGKFRKAWGNQTEIGREFGLSARRLGVLLHELGLKDPVSNEPTSKAMSDGYAVATPLKDGRAFFMWNKKKIGNLLDNYGAPRASKIEIEVSRVVSEMMASLKVAAKMDVVTRDKIERMVNGIADQIFNDVISTVDVDVREDVRIISANKLEREGVIKARDIV